MKMTIVMNPCNELVRSSENLGTRARGHANIEGTRARRARRARHLKDSTRKRRNKRY